MKSETQDLLDALRDDSGYKDYIEERFNNGQTIAGHDLYHFIMDKELFDFFIKYYPNQTKAVITEANRLFYRNKFNAISISRELHIDWLKVTTFQHRVMIRTNAIRERYKDKNFIRKVE